MKPFIALNIILFSVFLHAIEAPEFPEPHRYIVDRFSDSNPIGHTFLYRGIMDNTRPSIALSHQNREWGYNWFLMATVIPTQWGYVSFGYSNYATNNLPVTKKDKISIYLDGYMSDTFEIMAASFQPSLDGVQLQLILNYKYRQLAGAHQKKAVALDAHVTSKFILNNQLGLRMNNVLSTPYENKDGNEELPRYMGMYAWFPVSVFTLFFDANACLNYRYLSYFSGQTVVDIDEQLALLFNINYADIFSSVGIGTSLKLSDYFQLMYMHQQEKTDAFDLSIHSISIGVTF